MPPAVKSAERRLIEIKAWESSSQSPFGGFRMGGTDQRRFAISPDGRWLASEDAGGWQLELWDLASGKSLGKFGRTNGVVIVAFSPDAKTLYTSGASRGICPVDAWDMAQRRRKSLDEGANTEAVGGAAVSPDGKHLVLARLSGGAGPKPVRGDIQPGFSVWDAASGDELRRFAGPEVANPNNRRSQAFDSIAFAPDGRSLAVVSEGRVFLWEMATGKQRSLLGRIPITNEQSDDVFPACVDVSTDGRLVAVGCPNGAVRIWEVVSGIELPPLAGHMGAVRAVRFTSDGKNLLSVGFDRQLMTWPTAELRPWTPEKKALPPEKLGQLWDALLSNDARTLYGAVQNLAARPEQSLAFLRNRLSPVPAIPADKVSKLLETIANGDYNSRKRAILELRGLGELALPKLREEADKHYDELTRSLLEEMSSRYPTREQQQLLRAVDVLEVMNTDEARKLLKELAGGAKESMLTMAAQAAHDRLKGPAAGADERGWPGLDNDLGSEDPNKAFRALRAFVRQPKEGLPVLRARLTDLSSKAEEDGQLVGKLVAELDSTDFETREAAAKKLALLGKEAEPGLRKALANNPGLELKRQIEKLLKELGPSRLEGNQLHAERVLEALERINTIHARAVLSEIAKETKSPWLRQAAKESLKRMEERRK
jgi:hypothetical protein